MAWKQTMKYLRETNKIPKTWRGALKLWRIKKQHPNKEVIIKNGKFYYRGVLLQLRIDGDFSTAFYIDTLYEIKE